MHMRSAQHIVQVLFISAILLGRLATYSQDRWESVLGSYSNGHAFAATELTLRSDSTFQYRFFLDVGGWGAPVKGRWSLVEDTVYLSSDIYPRFIRITESEVPSDSITVILLDKSGNIVHVPYGPSIQVNAWNPDYNPWFRIVPLESQQDALVMCPWAVQKNDSNSPARFLTFKFGEVNLRYVVLHPTSNLFSVKLDLSEDDFYQEVFFLNEPLLIDGELVYEFLNGGWNYEYPLRKHPTQGD